MVLLLTWLIVTNLFAFDALDNDVVAVVAVGLNTTPTAAEEVGCGVVGGVELYIYMFG